jgi:hypothetical protein
MKEREQMKTIQEAAAAAIAVQDACNSSGVARSMVEAMDAIRASADEVRGAYGHPNRHPIVFLFLYKLMALNGHEPLNLWSEYDKAVKECEAIQAVAA